MVERVLLAVVLAVFALAGVLGLIWAWFVLQAVALLFAVFAQGAALT